MDKNYFIYSDDEYQKVKNITCNKTEEEIDSCLTSLKNWIKKELHLPQNEDDSVLLKMLRANKYSVEKTKGKLEMFYSGKSMLPEYFDNFSPKDKRMQKIMEISIVVPLPTLCPALERVVILVQRRNNNLEEFDETDYLRMVFMFLELRLLSDDICVGDAILADMSRSPLFVMAKFTPRLLQNVFSYVNGSYTDRIKSMNFINIPSYAYPIITVIKSLLKSKIADRVYVHKDLESLHKIIPKSALPKEYGGEQGSINEYNDEWNKFMLSKDAFLKERSKMKSNEELRIGEPAKSELFGIQGSFRKLVVD